MIPYTDLEEQVGSDFSCARRKAFLKRIIDRMRRDLASSQLLSFDEVRETLGANVRIDLGGGVIEVDKIVGSVSRYRDFDRAFSPAIPVVEGRWKQIDRAFHRGEKLPPVSLYKIGGAYFVLDGNHRVSVARYHGIKFIDAEVTEFLTPLPEGQRRRDEPRERKQTRRREIMDLYERVKQRREEVLHDVEHNRLARELRAARKRRASRTSTLAWEMRRSAGRLLKLLRASMPKTYRRSSPARR